MTDAAAITPEFGARLQDMLRWWERRPLRPHPPARPAGFNGGTIVVALLENIISGGHGLAAVLRPKLTNERQIIDLRGDVDDTAKFILRYFPDPEADPTNSQTTEEILATAFARVLLCAEPVEREIYAEQAKCVWDEKIHRVMDACGQCDDCMLVDSDSHPDFHVIYRELAKYHSKPEVRNRKALKLSVDVIREFLIDTAGSRPSRS